MGFIFQFIVGATVGAACVYNMDDFYYKTFKRHVAEPAKEELKKDEVDVGKLVGIVTRGLNQSYRELWP